MAAASVETDENPPEAFFRKTKSNNFFAIDTSSDKIELLTAYEMDDNLLNYEKQISP